MAKITRYQGNLQAFASNALGQERVVFGNNDAPPVESDDLTANITANFLRGWGVQPLGNKPPREWFNSVHWASTQLSAYLHQVGVAEWDDEQEYYVGSYAQIAGFLFVSKSDNNVGNSPQSDAVNWELTIHPLRTVQDLINSDFDLPEGTTLHFKGPYSDDEGSGGSWEKTSDAGAPSQTAEQRGDGSVTNANGSVWRLLSVPVFLEMMGYDGTNGSSLLSIAINNIGHVKTIPGKTYTFADEVVITRDDAVLDGTGSIFEVGANEVAGGNWILNNANNFEAFGFKSKAINRVAHIRTLPVDADLEGVNVHNVKFFDGFYSVRTGSVGGAYRVKDVNVYKCLSHAKANENSSHFVSSDSDGVTYVGNRCYGGQNASALGANKCTDITITGNRSFGMGDLIAGAEAAIQVENSVNATITGNVTDHDIWNDESSDVTITGNTCRRLRGSISEAGGTYDNIVFDANVAQRLQIESYGPLGASPSFNCKFLNNVIDPSDSDYLGSVFTSAISIEGTVCGKVVLEGNEVNGNAGSSCVSLNRNNPDAEFHFYDNDFGSQSHTISGTQGLLYEQSNDNPLQKNGNGYLDVYLVNDFSPSPLGAWVKMTFTGEDCDQNLEYSAAGFVPKKSGFYKFSGCLTINADSSGNDFGARIFKTSGTPFEVARLFFGAVASSGLKSCPFSTSGEYLTAGETYEFQVFADGATSAIVAGQAVSTLKVERV